MSRDLYDCVVHRPVISPGKIGVYVDELLKENSEVNKLLRNYLIYQVENVLCSKGVYIEGLQTDTDEEYRLIDAIFDTIDSDDLKKLIKDLPLNPFITTNSTDPRNRTIIKSNIEEATKSIKNIERI